jgi:hypothetical protein
MADNPKAADKRRGAPTASGEVWRQAEQLREPLAQTGDTTGRFIVTSMIGTAMLIAIPPFLVWLLFALVRWFVL